MKGGWAPTPLDGIVGHEVIPFAKLRRERLSSKFPGMRLILPAGSLKTRSNDTDYRFRAHSAFLYYSGITAADAVPDSVLILEPKENRHEALLVIHPRSPRNNDEFYRNARYGEFWIGRRMTLEETETRYGIKVALLDSLETLLSESVDSLLIRGEDPRIDSLIKSNDREEEFANVTSVMRMTKDQYEINEMQKAIDATSRGFADMVKVFPVATSHKRGERIIEGHSLVERE